MSGCMGSQKGGRREEEKIVRLSVPFAIILFFFRVGEASPPTTKGDWRTDLKRVVIFEIVWEVSFLLLLVHDRLLFPFVYLDLGRGASHSLWAVVGC